MQGVQAGPTGHCWHQAGEAKMQHSGQGWLVALTAPCWGCQELQGGELDQTWGTVSCGAVEWLQG